MMPTFRPSSVASLRAKKYATAEKAGAFFDVHSTQDPLTESSGLTDVARPTVKNRMLG